MQTIVLPISERAFRAIKAMKSIAQEFEPRKLTKQGVRDLNGPRMDGTGYNGHRSATCIHHKAPDMTPKHTLIETIADEFGMPKDLRFDCCSVCGEKLGEVDR